MRAVRFKVLTVYAGMLLVGHSAFGQQEAERLLADGDRLAWLKNWRAAEPFFERAEVLFRERGDKRNELYARISRMRGQLPSRGLFETSTYMASVLDDPLRACHRTRVSIDRGTRRDFVVPFSMKGIAFDVECCDLLV